MSIWDAVIGQQAAVALLQAAVANPVHAYLLLGPAGSGKRAAARAFAAALLCPDGGCGECSHCLRVESGNHPDHIVAEREGASISIEQIRSIVAEANRSPTERPRKVLVVTDMHLIEQRAPALLKTVEEPPATTVFVLLADSYPSELVTIASRCVVAEFGPVPDDVIAAVLVEEGADVGAAAEVAAAAVGNIELARLLAADPEVLARRRVWSGIPGRLDGRGHTVAAIADEVRTAADAIVAPLTARHDQERADIEARAERFQIRGVSKADEDRWKREVRRVRTDELRAGLRTLIAAYRDRLAAGDTHQTQVALQAVDLVQEAGEFLVRNPNEALLLQGLLVRLSKLSATRP